MALIQTITLPPQLHTGHKEPASERLHIFESGGDAYRYEAEGKPRIGGLWTSTCQKYLYSDWLRWCARPESWFHSVHGARRWILRPCEARIMVIDSVADYDKIVAAYPREHRGSGEIIPDWRKISTECDAVHFTINARMEAGDRFDEDDNPHPLIVWCCESTVWFRWCFDSVILGLEDDSDRTYSIEMTSAMQLKREKAKASS